MGSDAGYPTEVDGGDVTVAELCIDLTEVTTSDYERCVADGHCTADDVTKASSSAIPQKDQCNYGVPARASHPINCVDWNQANAYCGSIGKRLPTEEEWEYVARGGSEARLYPWPKGPGKQEMCWNQSSTCPVGTHPSSDARWGVHDMAGNVWEWTASRFCEYPLPSKHCGPLTVLRGGGWNTSDYSLVRGANRGAAPATDRGGALGFRCAADD